MIAHVERRQFAAGASAFSTSSIRIRCKDFTFLSFNFVSDQHCRDAFDSIMKLTCVNSVSKLYAFMYKPGSLERKHSNGWRFYDPAKEFERMGCFEGEHPAWRVTKINADHTFSPTYPSYIVVPAAISDTVLNYGAKYRSKLRFPALSYYHRFNKGSITRCSQPMVGLKQNRSVQDEKMVSAIFCSTQTPGVIGASSQENLIVDARPTTNAMAQTALGAGTENMENYKGAKKVYLGIDNIHVMRESLNKVVEALRDGDISSLPPNREILYKSNWLKYLSIILDGAVLIANQVHFNFAHVMIHCSDGWDRTAQLSGLAQIFLDPYFRTLDGFIMLVEKEWLAFGHRFAERSGHLNSEKHFVQRSGSDNNQGEMNRMRVEQKHDLQSPALRPQQVVTPPPAQHKDHQESLPQQPQQYQHQQQRQKSELLPRRSWEDQNGSSDPLSGSLQDMQEYKATRLEFPRTHIQPHTNTSTLYTTAEDEDSYTGNYQSNETSLTEMSDKPPTLTRAESPPPQQTANPEESKTQLKEVEKEQEVVEKLDPRVYASFNTMTLDSDPTPAISTRRFF
ncbi:hypothetical protein D0Z00_004179 [Geotrichum galactomycetum]|uniref:Uncharacterized protein n=1 Tax=Geotrichum galactomycetum TaxID=27317 RepID=A0ACB6UZ44_9ASCO|nr:hypothetical protein D0Z00_004179 [Geotrichum candidum]